MNAYNIKLDRAEVLLVIARCSMGFLDAVTLVNAPMEASALMAGVMKNAALEACPSMQFTLAELEDAVTDLFLEQNGDAPPKELAKLQKQVAGRREERKLSGN